MLALLGLSADLGIDLSSSSKSLWRRFVANLMGTVASKEVEVTLVRELILRLLGEPLGILGFYLALVACLST